MADRRRVTITFTQTYVFDDVDLATIKQDKLGYGADEEPATPEWLKGYIEQSIGDGEAQSLKQGSYLGEPQDPLGDWDYTVDMVPFCTTHPDEVIDGCWRGEDGAYCCRLCWEVTPHGVATMERINEARASVSDVETGTVPS